ncbi:MAG: ABC transporter ATP-binding protein [Lachnospiraceae bacterium]|nr:ABC transporter ATP-binding protein [Lachnospiraceae bacterium]
MITVEHISKSFRVAKRNAGFAEAVKALFNRQYETIRALDDISFTIEDGEMVGYIGPNGAGKSSTIKILSGILTPDSGTCVIGGRTPWKERKEHVRDIGVVFGQRSQLWWDVPVIDSFELLKDIYSVDEPVYRRNLDEMITLLNLGEIVKTPARQLSLGQRMRCEIAASLLHGPRILFLDEPTIGLDAVSKIAVRNFILEINRTHKTTVILTTHDMQDIEALARRILLIGKGKILLDGGLSDLKKQFGGEKRIEVEYAGGVPGTDQLPGGLYLLSSQQLGGGITRALYEAATDVLPISDAIASLSAGTEIRDISITGAPIDTVVAQLYAAYHI